MASIALPHLPRGFSGRWDAFLGILPITLKFEGIPGKVDDPDDRGGRTAYGVTQRAFTSWLKSQNRASRDVWTIKMPEVEAIYYRDYWLRAGCQWRDWPLDLLLFDAAVNHGVSRAVKLVIQSDGSPIKYLDARVAFYHAIVRNRPSQAKFLRGWLNRAEALRRIALPSTTSLEDVAARAA